MSDSDRVDPLALINKLAQEEKRLAETTFLAPVLAAGKVKLRVDGIVYDLTVHERQFEGWGIFRISKPGHAQLVERASISLVNNYLKLFPRKRFVLLDSFDGQWFALSSSGSDTRFALDGPIPIHLMTSSPASMDTVTTRFDGSAFWFEGVDRRRDPVVARTLRQALANKIDPDEVRAAGMTPEERLAYRILFLRMYGAALPVDDRTRIAEALRHAGATMESFSYHDGGENAIVRFLVDGQMHVVRIMSHDMSVISAGICLSGRDRDFDLTSLVGVFREHQTTGEDWEH